jgi:two-component system phosphate regulon sensor histidine kinase PhoR
MTFTKRNATPKQISIYVSVIVTIILVASNSIAYFLFYHTTNLWIIAGTTLFTILVTYFAFNIALESFLYRRIKLIYKSIHQLKVRNQNDELKTRIRNSDDIISDVNADVLEWAQDKKEEIDELKQLEEYRKEFIGNLSHELKTPIFNIQGYITTLIDGGAEDAEMMEKYLQNAERNVERMISLVEDLDTIHKLESSRMHLEMEKFDVVKLAKEVMDMQEMKAQQKGIQISFKEEYSKPLWVYADKHSIKQVFTNLIVNSIVYGNEGGSTKIAYYDMDENILVEVADDGPGIDEKHLPRLFERFYRVDKSRSRHQGGTGLGLSIVKHIMESHQQSINVRSTINHGSTFSFTLKKFKA